MHDIQFIRDNPKAFDAAMVRRGLSGDQSETILAIDEQHRAVKTEAQTLQSERNDLSKKIGELKKAGKDAEELIAHVGDLKQKLTDLEDEERNLHSELQEVMLSLPNLFDKDVPDGESDEDNVILDQWGEPEKFDFKVKDHVTLGENLGLLDMERAAKISGSRFYVSKGALARLERALQHYCLDVNTEEFGYTEISSPILVREETMIGTGQLPKFGEDSFQTTNGHWLIPTAEVPLTNLVREQILDEDDLPLRFTALTPCFRSEAGSAGKDTRGMIRLHQFWKVELVSITTPERSDAELERMLDIEETLFQRLNIPYEKMIQCTGDTGFGSLKTYDLNGWFPGQDTYRELTSCSTYGTFQARRMNARYRPKGEDTPKTAFLHTLNGSALSTTRFLVAIMENYQTAEGHIKVPDVLVPYMNGLEIIKGEQ